ncbi:MAG: hypothetical protein JNL39_21630, partial [Opitutaceae bacterium]|nr:hypothetical protein [Opitutaceae bacterium]
MDGTPWLSPSHLKSLHHVRPVTSLLRWVALLLLPFAGLAAPADFKAVTGLGTRLTGGGAGRPQFANILPGLDGPFFEAETSEIALEAIALASEVDEGNGFIRLGFTLRLKNNGQGYYEEVKIEWEPVNAEWTGVGVPVGSALMPDLPPGGMTTRAQPYEVRVPAARRNRTVTEVLAGQRLRPAAIELFQFKERPVAVDAPTDAAFRGESRIGPLAQLSFSTSTPLLASLRPGDLLVESVFVYRLRRNNGSEPGLVPPPVLSDYVCSSDVSADGTTRIFQVVTVAAQGSGVNVTGRHVDILDVLDVGTMVGGALDAIELSQTLPPGVTFRDIYRPAFGNNASSAFTNHDTGVAPDFRRPGPPGEITPRSPLRLLPEFQGRAAFGFGSIHVPFNDVAIAPGITLDGEALLDALNIEIRFRFRRLLSPRITVKLATKTELTMRLTAGAQTRHLLDEERSLFSVPLPTITFAIGPVPIEIAPFFKGKVGVRVDAPTAVIIPIHGSFEAGCVMSWDGSRPPSDQFRYRSFQTSQPLKVSNPMLNDSLAFTASAFFESGLEVQVNRSAGPYVGARVSANFELNPANDPWWSLDFDFKTITQFRLKVLGFDIAALADSVSDAVRFPSPKASGPVPHGSGRPGGAPPGSFNPVSGGETRWARLAGLGAPSALKVARVAGSSEDVFMTTDAMVTPPIVRLDAKGNVVWAKGALLVGPQRIAPTADGGLAFVTGGGTSLVAWLNGAGAPQAARLFQPQDAAGGRQVYYIGAMLAAPTGETYVIGSIALPEGNDVFIAKYAANRDLAFFKRYGTPTLHDAVTGAAFHPSGDLIICGTSDGRPDPAQFSAQRDATLNGGLLMRVTPAGAVVWARRALAPMFYNSVTVAPDGAIFAAGRFAGQTSLDWPGLLVAKHEPAAGDLEKAVLIGEAMSGSNARGLNDDYLAGGRTPHDEANKIVWTANGLYVSGNTIVGSDFATRAPLVMCLTERLSMRWWTAHDSAGSDDTIADLVPTEQGLFTAGITRGLGATPGGEPAPALLGKLPLDGKMEFARGVNSKYLIPSIVQLPAYGVYYPGIATPATGYIGNERITATPVDHRVFNEATTPPSFSDVPLDLSPPQQRDPASTAIAPFISRQPASHAIEPAGTVVFSVGVVATPAPTFQWRFNNANLAGQTGATLVIVGAGPANAGDYTVVVTNSGGTATSAPAALTVAGASSNPGRLSNLSILTPLNAGETMTMGAVLGGAGTSGAKPLLVRAAGPSLAPLGVASFLPDPTMSLIRTSVSPAVTVATNDDWGGTAVLSAVFTSVGAFAFSAPTSRDAAIFQPALASGGYTVEVKDAGTGTGTIIAELYDATPTGAFSSTTPRVVNVSVLKTIAVGTSLTAGFVVGGAASKTVLIRAIGPALGLAP